MMSKNYNGILYFTDNDKISMKSFIVHRDNNFAISSISFELSTTWGEDSSLWTVDSELVRREDDSFISPRTYSTCEERGECSCRDKYPCIIKLSKVKFENEDKVFIEGTWFEIDDGEYSFSGELQLNSLFSSSQDQKEIISKKAFSSLETKVL